MPASPVPVRTPAGATSDPPYGPLADSGFGNPFFYHQFQDDFDYSLGATGLYTVSKGSSGTAAHNAADGGTILLTTAATNNDYVSIQLPAASVQLPQATQKKLFFLTRVQLSDVTNSSLIVGLMDTTTTVFTGGSQTDGIWFSKASGGTTLNINTASGGTIVTTAIPAAAYTLTNGAYIDLAFYMDRNGYLNAFVGSTFTSQGIGGLVGYLPQSGTGSTNTAGVSSLPSVGRCLQITSFTVSSAILNMTMGIQAGAAAAKSLTADFWCVQKER